jgi:hypothetical protein
MRGNNSWLRFSRLGQLDRSDLKVPVVLLVVELLCEWVDSRDSECAAKSNNWLTWEDLIAGEIVVANEVLSWLIDSKALWEFLSLQEYRERVTTVVSVMDFTDFTCIICKIVVNNVWVIVTLRVISKNSAVIVEELLL